MKNLFFSLSLLIIIFIAIFHKNNYESFQSKKTVEYTLPHGQSNTKQTKKLTKNLLKGGSQANADAKYDSQVGPIDDINPPAGTT